MPPQEERKTHMTGTGKSYTVTSWFADKVANEVKSNITMCDVFAILQETEKAVYAMLNIGTMRRRCMWVPKSALVEREVREEWGEPSQHETYRTDDYDEAVAEFTAFWKQYM